MEKTASTDSKRRVERFWIPNFGGMMDEKDTMDGITKDSPKIKAQGLVFRKHTDEKGLISLICFRSDNSSHESTDRVFHDYNLQFGDEESIPVMAEKLAKWYRSFDVK